MKTNKQKNPRSPDKAFSNVIAMDLYPTIGLGRASTSVNFGSKPFKFTKLPIMIEEEKRDEILQVESTKLAPDLVFKLIRSYLINQGYSNTLEKLDETNKEKGKLPNSSLYDLQQRKSTGSSLIQFSKHATKIIHENPTSHSQQN